MRRTTNANHLESIQLADAPLGPLDPLNVALQRVRELELELAQTKLAHVEAECKNQDLNHQLNTTLTEIQNNRSSWQPWLSKTFNQIQERVSTRRDMPSFQSYTGGVEGQIGGGGSSAADPLQVQQNMHSKSGNKMY